MRDFSEEGLVTAAEFARLIGRTKRRVYNAIRDGKITSEKIKNRHYVNVEVAKRQWRETMSPTSVAKQKKIQEEQEQNAVSETERFLAKQAGETDEKKITLAEAQRREKVFKARQAELKYLEQAGELIKISTVRKEGFEIARKTRDAIMSIPTRVAHEFASETDPHKIEVDLSQELNRVLQKLAEDLENDESESDVP